MVCNVCGKEGEIPFDIMGWHQDLAIERFIDEETETCYECLNDTSKPTQPRK